MIWQLFNAVLKGSEVAGETDMEFLDGNADTSGRDAISDSFWIHTEVQEKMNAMDKGIHIGSWGQLQGMSITLYAHSFNSHILSR